MMKNLILILSIGLAVASCGKKKEVAYMIKCQGSNMNYMTVTTSKMTQNYYFSPGFTQEARVIGAKKDTIRVQLFTFNESTAIIQVDRDGVNLGQTSMEDDPYLEVITK